MKDIEQWTKENPIGKEAVYQSILGVSELKKVTIKSEPWEVCGAWVVKVSGVSGGVDVDHIMNSPE